MAEVLTPLPVLAGQDQAIAGVTDQGGASARSWRHSIPDDQGALTRRPLLSPDGCPPDPRLAVTGVIRSKLEVIRSAQVHVSPSHDTRDDEELTCAEE